MEPRYEPAWEFNNSEEFLGHAGEIDVWYGPMGDEPYILVVGPDHRKLVRNDYNYDVYGVEPGHLTPEGLLRPDSQDIHVELHEMCEIYTLCEKHGVFEKAK